MIFDLNIENEKWTMRMDPGKTAEFLLKLQNIKYLHYYISNFIVKTNQKYTKSNYMIFSEIRFKCFWYFILTMFLMIIGSGSGGWISWDQNRRSNHFLIMRSNYFLIMRSNYFASFHEVKIPDNDSISWLRHFSWD